MVVMMMMFKDQGSRIGDHLVIPWWQLGDDLVTPWWPLEDTTRPQLQPLKIFTVPFLVNDIDVTIKLLEIDLYK